MFDVLGAGADRLADDGAVEEKPDAEIDQKGDGDDHQSIDRDVRPDDVDLGADRHRHRARHQAPEVLDDADAADQHAERRDHGERQVPFVDAPEHHALHHQGGEAGDDHAGYDAEPYVAQYRADRKGDVGADRVIQQLIETDDAHQAETEPVSYTHLTLQT